MQRSATLRPEARSDVSSKAAGGLTSRANSARRPSGKAMLLTAAAARRSSGRCASAVGTEAAAATAAAAAAATARSATATSASPPTPRSAVASTSKQLKRSSGVKAVPATARAAVAGPNAAPHSAAIPAAAAAPAPAAIPAAALDVALAAALAAAPAAASAAAPASSMANRRLSEFGLPSPSAMAALFRHPTVDQPTQTTYRQPTGELPSPDSNALHNLHQLPAAAKSLPPGVEGRSRDPPIIPPAQEPTLAGTLDARPALETLDDKAGNLQDYAQETTESLGTLDRDGLLPKALAKALTGGGRTLTLALNYSPTSLTATEQQAPTQSCSLFSLCN